MKRKVVKINGGGNVVKINGGSNVAKINPFLESQLRTPKKASKSLNAWREANPLDAYNRQQMLTIVTQKHHRSGHLSVLMSEGAPFLIRAHQPIHGVTP